MVDQVDLSPNSVRELAKALATAMTSPGNPTFGNPASRLGQGSSPFHSSSIAELHEEAEELAETIKVLDAQIRKAIKSGMSEDSARVKQLREEKRDAEAIRTSHREYIKELKHGNGMIHQTTEARKKEVKAIREARESMINFAERIGGGGGFFGGVKQVMTDYRKSLETGLDINYLNNAYLGMTQEQILDMQKEFRRVSNALGDEGLDFVSTINQLQNELYSFTGDAEASARLAANMQQSARMMGLAGNDAQRFIKGTMMDTFKVFNSNLSMTAVEFGNLLTSLSSDKDIRLETLRVQRDQRGAMMSGIIALNKYFLTLGYATDEAESLTKQFVKMRGDDPVERIRRAARMRAFAGAMGMSAEDSKRMQQLGMKSLNQMSEGELTELRQLQSRLGTSARGAMGQGLGSEIGVTQMMAKLGIRDVMDESALDTLQSQTMKQTGVQQESVKTRNEFFTEALQYMDNISSLLKSGAAAIVTAIVAASLRSAVTGKLPGGTAFKKGGAGGTGFGGGAKAGASKWGGRLLKGVPIAGGLLAGGIAMSSMDQSIGMNEETFGVGGSVLGGAAGGALAGAAIGSIVPVFGTAIGAAIGGIAGAMIGEEAGKALWGVFKDESQKTIERANEATARAEDSLRKLRLLTDKNLTKEQFLKEQYAPGSAERKLQQQIIAEDKSASEERDKARTQEFNEALMDMFGSARSYVAVGPSLTDVSGADIKQSLERMKITTTQLKELGMGVLDSERFGKGVTQEERIQLTNLIDKIQQGNDISDFHLKRLLLAMTNSIDVQKEQLTEVQKSNEERLIAQGNATSTRGRK